MMKEYILNNNIKVPVLAFGTYLTVKEGGKEVIRLALEAGYRHFDTASFYANEKDIGEVFRKEKITRNQLFITSKVWKDQMGYEETLRAFHNSLEILQTEYLDLYLIHWPISSRTDPYWKEKNYATWCALEELYMSKKVRAIGLSNFLPHHIESILEKAKIVPMVNQLELHAGYLQEAAMTYCRAKGIVLEGWSPLGRRRVLENELVVEMSQKYGVSPAQFLLRFLLQLNIIPIPKASNIERMKENMEIFDFEISTEDMHIIRCMPPTGWSGEHPEINW